MEYSKSYKIKYFDGEFTRIVPKRIYSHPIKAKKFLQKTELVNAVAVYSPACYEKEQLRDFFIYGYNYKEPDKFYLELLSDLSEYSGNKLEHLLGTGDEGWKIIQDSLHVIGDAGVRRIHKKLKPRDYI